MTYNELESNPPTLIVCIVSINDTHLQKGGRNKIIPSSSIDKKCEEEKRTSNGGNVS